MQLSLSTALPTVYNKYDYVFLGWKENLCGVLTLSSMRADTPGAGAARTSCPCLLKVHMHMHPPQHTSL